ncbi:hypothetical protein LQK38_004747, partial [Vibrio parahaemolyticus]|nr:hypothetical protein [Vibrio parahaemolyticus]
VKEVYSEKKNETFYIMNYLNESKNEKEKGFYIPKNGNAMFISKEEFDLVKNKEVPFFIETPEKKQEFKVI